MAKLESDAFSAVNSTDVAIQHTVGVGAEIFSSFPRPGIFFVLFSRPRLDMLS